MDGRGYGSGFSSWGSGGGSGNRGSGNFDMYRGGDGGYKDSMSGLGGSMKRGYSSGGSLLSSTGTNADAVIAKINQRLDMLTQMEGGMKGGRGDRFDNYGSFDSRLPSLTSPRDLYRPGGGSYGEGRSDSVPLAGQRGASGYGGGGSSGFATSPPSSSSSSYGLAKMRQNVRDSFSGGSGGGGWTAAGRRPPRRGGNAGGRGFGNRRSDPLPQPHLGGSGGGSYRGHSPSRGGKLPSLLSNRVYPESGGYHRGPAPPPGHHDFPGRLSGGGPRARRQRVHKRPLNRPQVRPQDDVQKKRKQPLTPTDEPESKMNRTEDGGTAATAHEPAKTNGEVSEAKAPVTETTPPADESMEPSTQQEATSQEEKSPQDKPLRAKKRRGFIERMAFVCSVCKFRSFYEEDMTVHLDSRFHKEHFKYLSSQLSRPTTDFLQEYLLNKTKKTVQRIGQLDNPSSAICQIYREQDVTRDLPMEHFMRKVEAAHCGACDLFIPMQIHLIQKHLKSADHNYNRKGMMEQSKRSCLSVARSILNHKVIGKKLESYLKGENPFTGNHDDHEAEDSVVMEVSDLEASKDGSAVVTLPPAEEALPGSKGAAHEEEKMEEEEPVIEVEGRVKEEGDSEGRPVKEEAQAEEAHEEEEGFEVGEEEEAAARGEEEEVRGEAEEEEVRGEEEEEKARGEEEDEAGGEEEEAGGDEGVQEEEDEGIEAAVGEEEEEEEEEQEEDKKEDTAGGPE